MKVQLKTWFNTESAEVIDYIKALGFKYSTLAGITFSVADMKIPDSKKDILADAEEKVDKYEKSI